ncbi:hypothetical protein COUCH_05490 [Couchioplanes caeruleus]|uniref:hypothetical protein n=1 Tax=Couchioplanes caeruleus TaxID=56438 RepID=UPI0020BFFE8F|nr:hypothetical protein [Couchioplanes caeruleus]UQU65773.1 hypothetical protein COUCH_05490 [Couchioplanes caeruleus]
MTREHPTGAARLLRIFSTWRAALAAAVAVAVAVVVVVGSNENAHHAEGSAGRPVTGPANLDVCVDFPSRAECRQATAGGRSWRYTLHRPARATKETVIVDFGGPGVPVLSDDYLSGFVTQAPQVFDRYNVIAVDEPWSTRAVDPACRQSLSEFASAIRSTPTGPALRQAGALRDTCDIQHGRWGFTPESYRQVIDAVGRKENLSYVGFIGHSFGSMRLRYLQAGPMRRTLRWAALSRPYPVGVTGATLLTQRAEAMSTFLKSHMRAEPTVQSPRSGGASVTRFDALSAEVEIGYLAADGQAQAAADIAAGNHDVTSRLSDQLWQRYGDGDMSPAYLAQLDELCGAVRLELPESYRNPADILAAQLLPCSPDEKPDAARLSLGSTPLCVAAAAGDTVSPAVLVRAAFKDASAKTVWVALRDRSHTGDSGIDKCLTMLGQRSD